MPFNAGEIAGVEGFEQVNWNFLNAEWSGNVANDALFASGIVNSTGEATTSLLNIDYPTENSDAVHWASANTWRSGAGNTDVNATLMNAYLDDGGDGQPYVNFSLANAVLDLDTVDF